MNAKQIIDELKRLTDPEKYHYDPLHPEKYDHRTVIAFIKARDAVSAVCGRRPATDAERAALPELTLDGHCMIDTSTDLSTPADVARMLLFMGGVIHDKMYDSKAEAKS